MVELILASKSKVRKEILDKNNILFKVEPSNVDEEPIKQSLINEKASPEIISKNLAEIKASKVSQKYFDILVLKFLFFKEVFFSSTLIFDSSSKNVF